VNGEELTMKDIEIIEIKIYLSVKLIFDILYILKINQNLLSAAQLPEKGYKVFF